MITMKTSNHTGKQFFHTLLNEDLSLFGQNTKLTGKQQHFGGA
jgi:hypothetical protein